VCDGAKIIIINSQSNDSGGRYFGNLLKNHNNCLDLVITAEMVYTYSCRDLTRSKEQRK